MDAFQIQFPAATKKKKKTTCLFFLERIPNMVTFGKEVMKKRDIVPVPLARPSYMSSHLPEPEKQCSMRLYLLDYQVHSCI